MILPFLELIVLDVIKNYEKPNKIWKNSLIGPYPQAQRAMFLLGVSLRDRIRNEDICKRSKKAEVAMDVHRLIKVKKGSEAGIKTQEKTRGRDSLFPI